MDWQSDLSYISIKEGLILVGVDWSISSIKKKRDKAIYILEAKESLKSVTTIVIKLSNNNISKKSKIRNHAADIKLDLFRKNDLLTMNMASSLNNFV